uniref:Reverse transcriptase Ty1/copia-type domain-containing protein n=1 Tax=Peronospora matthiolae TaxID=2874970 RepID=A0AAV1UD36_9STRA
MAERANRTLVEMARCMLKDSDMEKTFWAEALVTAAYIRNTISTATRTHTTPYEEKFNRLFDYGSLRVFGTECFAHVPKTKRSKLDDSGVRCRMLGYLENQKGNRLLNASTVQIMHSRSVTFDESAREKVKPETDEDVESDGHETEMTDTKFHGSVDANLNDNDARGMASEHQLVHCNYPQTHQLQIVDPRGSLSLPGFTSIQPHGNAEVQVQGHHQLNGCTDIVLPDPEESMSPRMTGRQMITSKPSGIPDRDGLNQRRVRPARKKRGILRYEDEFNGMRRMDFNEADLEDEFDGLHCYSTALNDEKQTTYDGIMQSELKVQWKAAMDAEIKSLSQHKTWELVDLPPGKKMIGSRWLFKVKLNADVSINKFKARLVAQGFTQQFGVDFNEKFAPVAKQTTVRTVLSIAAGENLDAEQVTVDTAFWLHRSKKSCISSNQTTMKIRRTHTRSADLLKSLYGTKQTARQWNKTLDDFFGAHDFV